MNFNQLKLEYKMISFKINEIVKNSKVNEPIALNDLEELKKIYKFVQSTDTGRYYKDLSGVNYNLLVEQHNELLIILDSILKKWIY